MNGYMTYIGRTKDVDSKKKSESSKSLPNKSDLLKHRRRVPDRPDIAMEDMQIRYRSNQTVIQMIPTHASFKAHSYHRASRSTGLGRHARELLNMGESDSRILRASVVEDNGVPDSRIEGSSRGIDYTIANQAHHIVETSNRIGRRILANAGINHNSAANGVLLPEVEGDGTGNAAIHKGSHLGAYRVCVNRALSHAIRGQMEHSDAYKESVLVVLDRIRRILLNKNVAINKRGDPDYKNGRPGYRSIRDIFHDEGLF